MMASETAQSNEQHILLQLGESSDEAGCDHRIANEKQKQIEEEEWRMKFHEAALYLREGERHDTERHPTDKKLLPIYFLTRNKYFNIALLLTSIVYMALAIVEKPGQPLFYCPGEVQITVEVVCLTFFGVDLVMKMLWLGRNGFLRNTRSMLASAAVIALFIEMVVFYSIGSMQSRYMRILRSVFLLTNEYTKPVRQFVSDYVKSLGPIIRMLFLIMLLMVFFTLLGFNIFGKHNPFFESIKSSFVSLFVLLTTANFPDVMMPSYARQPVSVFFFILYIGTGIYLLMNLLFAVVYNKFTETQLAMLKSVFHHRRKCAEKAFYLLSLPESPCALLFPQYEGLLRLYCPKMTTMDIYRTFKALDDDNSGAVRLNEFCDIYEVRHYKWHKAHCGDSCRWWQKATNLRGRKFLSNLNKFLSSRLFVALINTVIILNTIALIIALIHLDGTSELLKEVCDNVELVCSIIYVLETILKIIAYGPKPYFQHGWNIFDFIISRAAFIGQLVELFHRRTMYVAVIRRLRLLRLLEADEFYRHILATTIATFRIFCTMAIVVIVVYYTYGIMGIGFFADASLENCCSDAPVAAYYVKNNFSDGFFYKNNFDNILPSMVTLFELTVINNWFVIMDAYSIVYTEWARVYFMVFYLQMMILTNMVLSSILGSFMFRMQYKRHMVGDETTDQYYVYEIVSVNKHEIARVYHQHKSRNYSGQKAKKNQYVELQTHKHLKLNQLAALDAEKIEYEGKRKKLEYELSLEMHATEVKQWRNEADFLGNLKSVLHRTGNSSMNVVALKKPEPTELPAWLTRKYWDQWVNRSKKYINKDYWLENAEKAEHADHADQPDGKTVGTGGAKSEEKPATLVKSASRSGSEQQRKSQAGGSNEQTSSTATEETPVTDETTVKKVNVQLDSIRPPSLSAGFGASQPRREPKMLSILLDAMKAAEQEKKSVVVPLQTAEESEDESLPSDVEDF